jgi:hypothetical protein
MTGLIMVWAIEKGLVRFQFDPKGDLIIIIRKIPIKSGFLLKSIKNVNKIKHWIYNPGRRRKKVKLEFASIIWYVYVIHVFHFV